jgi:hypothetical protein
MVLGRRAQSPRRSRIAAQRGGLFFRRRVFRRLQIVTEARDLPVHANPAKQSIAGKLQGDLRIKACVERAVGIEPPEIGTRDAVDCLERTADKNLSVWLWRDRLEIRVGVESRIEPRIGIPYLAPTPREEGRQRTGMKAFWKLGSVYEAVTCGVPTLERFRGRRPRHVHLHLRCARKCRTYRWSGK